MPIDKYGKRADIIQASEARTNRMNPGGLHEMYYNDASWHLRRHVLARLGIEFFEGITLRDRTTVSFKREAKQRALVKSRAEWFANLHATNPTLVEGIWDYVIKYYRLIAPLQAHIYDRESTPPWKHIYTNLATIVEDMVYLDIPPDYAVNYLNVSQNVKEHVGFDRDRVTYVGYSGRPTKTKQKVRIGPMNWMLLEKVADSWSAVAVAKVQHFGFLAQISAADKYSDPGRRQPTKGLGETEFRIMVSTCGQRAAAELADRNNNPVAQRIFHRSILTHPTPGAIAKAIDRREVPYGGHKGVRIFHHFLNCGGLALNFAPEEGT